MGEEFIMMCILSLVWLGVIIVLSWTNGLTRFNPVWVVAGNTGVIMIVVIYAAMWFLRMCTALEHLLSILTGQKLKEAHPSLQATLQRLRQIYKELGQL